MFKSKKLSLLMALVFAFTVIFPVAAFAADEAKFGYSYTYVTADEEQYAGSVTVKPDTDASTCEAVYIEVTLPSGVEFTDDPTSDDVKAASEKKFVQVSGFETFGFDYADDDVIKVWVDGEEWVKNINSTTAEVKFDFSVFKIDIEDDFTGNLDVDVEVNATEKGKDAIAWTISDSLTIAKVTEDDVTVSVGTVKKISKGSDNKAAKITIEESRSKVFAQGERIYLEVEGDDVEFSVTKDGAPYIDVSYNGVSVGSVTFDQDDDEKDVLSRAYVDITKQSGAFPGEIKFTPYLDVSPDATGEVEISVWSEVENDSGNWVDGELDEETVTVATVGDVTAEISKVEDNDTVAYAGQVTELDVEFRIETTDGSDFKDNAGDIITFELSNGEFVDFDRDKVVEKGTKGNVKLYSDDEAFYYTIGSNDKDELTFSNLTVKLDNDAEPGDLVLTVGGDYGDLGEIVIGQIAKPFTVTADKPAILAEALGQEAGDLIITETDNDAFNKGDLIYVELPSGVELSAKPKIDVEEGNADAEIFKYDDDYFVIEITKESGGKASVLRVYNIKYDTGKLALTGDVELKFRGDDDLKKDSEGNLLYDNYQDDSVFFKVANATVVDENVVTATFTVGDEGVAVKNGRTLVQVNTLCDVLGLQKSWDEVNKIAYFVKGGTVVAFPIDKNEISINGNVIPVDQGGTIINGFTYATLRGLEMAFGGTLDWDNDTKTATFNFQK